MKNKFGNIDLTSGKIWKVLILFAIPILLSSLLNNAFSLINSLILKETVGGDAVTSVNSTASLSSILFQFAYGCTSGFAVICSNRKGKQDLDGTRKAFLVSLILSVRIGVIITTIGLVSLDSLLRILNINEIFIPGAKNYFNLMLIFFVVILLSNMISNFLRAIGNSFITLIISIFSTIINVGMAYLLTGVIKLDTRGVAIATITSHLFIFVASFVYLYVRHKGYRFKLSDFKNENKTYLDALKIGLPLGFQWSILFIGSFIQNSQINKFGPYAQNGVTCYSNFEGYLTIPISVLSTALLDFVGQNYGAKKYDRLKNGIKFNICLVFCVYLLILAIGLPLVNYVPYIFLPKSQLSDPLIKQKIFFYCSSYLWFVIPALIFQGLLTTFRSSLQGIKKSLWPFFSGIGELGARSLVCFTFPTLFNPSNPLSYISYRGLCLSTPLAWIVSTVIMGAAVYYFIFSKKHGLKIESTNSITNKE